MHRCWVPAVDVGVIGAKGGYLKLKVVLQYDDYAKMRTDRVRAREKRLHSFRARVSGDVVILRCQTAHHVAHATACEIRDVSLLTQARRDFARGLFHRRGFHTITVAASLCEAQSACRFRVEGAVQLQPGATCQEQICGNTQRWSRDSDPRVSRALALRRDP